jgi:hypothetical protein
MEEFTNGNLARSITTPAHIKILMNRREKILLRPKRDFSFQLKVEVTKLD